MKLQRLLGIILSFGLTLFFAALFDLLINEE